MSKRTDFFGRLILAAWLRMDTGERTECGIKVELLLDAVRGRADDSAAAAATDGGSLVAEKQLVGCDFFISSMPIRTVS